AAAAYVSGITQRNRQQIALIGVIEGWLEKGTEAEINAWIETLSDHALRERAKMALLQKIGERNPSEAIRRLKTNPTPEGLSGIYSIIGAALREDPRLAVESVESLPPGRVRNQAIQALINQWAHTDPEAAQGWIRMLPPGGARNQGWQMIIMQKAQTDPHAAIAMAEAELPPGHMRANAVRSAVAAWAHHDQAAALAYVEALSS